MSRTPSPVYGARSAHPGRLRSILGMRIFARAAGSLPRNLGPFGTKKGLYPGNLISRLAFGGAAQVTAARRLKLGDDLGFASDLDQISEEDPQILGGRNCPDAKVGVWGKLAARFEPKAS